MGKWGGGAGTSLWLVGSTGFNAQHMPLLAHLSEGSPRPLSPSVCASGAACCRCPGDCSGGRRGRGMRGICFLRSCGVGVGPPGRLGRHLALVCCCWGHRLAIVRAPLGAK
jgi:hypothetical protein